MQAKFIGIVKDGAFIPDYPDQRRAYLMACGTKPLCETFGLPEKDQTAEQRGYYWGVICQKYGDEIGDTKEGVDFDLRNVFLSVDRDKAGQIKQRIKSTSELTRQEYSRYIDNVIILLAQQGYVVEPPNRNWNNTGWYEQARTPLGTDA